MSNINDGGPAFPVVSEVMGHCSGMTLRDYFAAKAMQGFAADPSMDEVEIGDIADLAYEMADAMLLAREAK